MDKRTEKEKEERRKREADRIGERPARAAKRMRRGDVQYDETKRRSKRKRGEEIGGHEAEQGEKRGKARESRRGRQYKRALEEAMGRRDWQANYRRRMI